MIEATLQETVRTTSIPSYLIATFLESNGVAAGTDSTALIGLSLPCLSSDEPSYRQNPRSSTTGRTYAIELVSFAISSNSTDFDVAILNVDDVTKVQTINEVARYETINKSYRVNPTRLIISNKDTTLSSYIYLYVKNDDSIATGPISVELTYLPLQDRPYL